MTAPTLVAVSFPGTPQVVATGEAKAHLNVQHGDDDAYIAALINAVQLSLDGGAGSLGRALTTQQWLLKLPCFPGNSLAYARRDVIMLPLPPTVTVDEVAYYNSGATKIVLTPNTDYKVAPGGLYGDTIWPVSYWPVDFEWGRPDAVQIKFTAGYASAGAVPEPIKAAIKLMVADLYANRETVVVGTNATPIPMTPTVARLLAPYQGPVL